MKTREQVNGLKHGDILNHTFNRNADGTPTRWRVNGQVKTWKTRPTDYQVPLKHGLFSYGYLTPSAAHLLCLSEDMAKLAQSFHN